MTNAEKRQPILADRFLATPRDANAPLVHPKALDQMRSGIMKAERFVLDVEASERIAQVVMDVPDLLVREHRFARAPYDVTWIEYDAFAYWMTFRNADPKRYDANGEYGDPETADKLVGFLIDHGRINVVSVGKEANSIAMVTPLQYRLHTEWPVADQLEFARRSGCSRLGIDAFLWGSSMDNMPSDQWRLLRDYNAVEFVPTNPKYDMLVERMMKDAGMVNSVRGAVGELRTIIAILLMLNRPSLMRYRNSVPSHRQWLKGKFRPFMSHTTVTVSLDAVAGLRLVGTSNDDPALRRRHRVRGHYCHDQTARDYMRIAGCIHDWQDMDADWHPWPDAPPDEVDHWLCGSCGGKRWWRDAHHRGTAQVGFVAHDGYEVTN